MDKKWKKRALSTAMKREREIGDFVVFWVFFIVKRKRKVIDGREKGGAKGYRKKEKGK